MEKPVRDLCSCSLRDDDDSSWQKQDRKSHVSVVRSANFAGGLDVSDEGKKNQRHSWVFGHYYSCLPFAQGLKA